MKGDEQALALVGQATFLETFAGILDAPTSSPTASASTTCSCTATGWRCRPCA